MVGRGRRTTVGQGHRAAGSMGWDATGGRATRGGPATMRLGVARRRRGDARVRGINGIGFGPGWADEFVFKHFFKTLPSAPLWNSTKYFFILGPIFCGAL